MHLLESQEVGLDGDAEVTDALEDLKGSRLFDSSVLKALAVDFQDLVPSLEADIVGLGAPLNLGDEDATSFLVATNNVELQGLVSRGPAVKKTSGKTIDG